MRFPRENFWYFHVGLGLVFIIINRAFFDIDIYYFDILIFLFPAIGFGGLLFINLLPKLEMDYQMIEESSDFKTYLKNRRDIEFIDLAVDFGTMGAYDVLSTGSPEEKKKFLMNFNPPEESFKVEIFEKALLDEDTDVIHYAATGLNWLYQKHRNRIAEAEKSDDLDEIFISYKEYMESGLLKGEILEFYQKRALKILKKLFEENREYAPDILMLYKNMGDENQCQKYLEEFLREEYPQREILNFALEYYYENNKYEKIIQLKDLIFERDMEIPYHLKRKVKGA